MKTVTKKDLVDRIAESTGQRRIVVKQIVQSFLDEIIGELSANNRLEFRDFGVFEIRERGPRVAQNPKTMEKVPVPRKRTVKFKVGRMMKQQLHANGSASPEQRHEAARASADGLSAPPAPYPSNNAAAARPPMA